VQKNPLTLASEMIVEFGTTAEIIAGDHMDAALQVDNSVSFDEWCLVAKAIALLTRTSTNESASNSDADIPPVIATATLLPFEPKRARR
jgi:hypothetical protein